MATLTIHTDGGARGNPGPAAVGIVLKMGEWEELFGLPIGQTTNNVAEYTGVIEALKRVKILQEDGMSISHLDFYLDSELVIKQINGEYRIKEPTLIKLHQEIKELLALIHIPSTFSHVLRASNKQADMLVNLALDGQLPR